MHEDSRAEDDKHEKKAMTGVRRSWTHKARRGGRGCLGWSAAVRGRARISGSAGSDNASGPCSAYFLSLWTQTGKHVVTASKRQKKQG